MGFLMSLGAFRREWTVLSISAAGMVLYGGAVQPLLDIMPGTGWSGRLFEFMPGVLSAWWTRNERSRSYSGDLQTGRWRPASGACMKLRKKRFQVFRLRRTAGGEAASLINKRNSDQVRVARW